MKIARVSNFEIIDCLGNFLKILQELVEDAFNEKPQLSGILLKFEIGLFLVTRVTNTGSNPNYKIPVIYKPKPQDKKQNIFTKPYFDLSEYDVSEHENAQVTKLADLENFLDAYRLSSYYFRTESAIYEIIPIQTVSKYSEKILGESTK